jgi:hypothetical protein
VSTFHVLQVTAVLSVPLLDIALLVSLVPWSRRRFISQDLVFLESYKPVSVIHIDQKQQAGFILLQFERCLVLLLQPGPGLPGELQARA